MATLAGIKYEPDGDDDWGDDHQTILDNMPQLVWIADREGRLEYANRRWLEYTGLTLEKGVSQGWDYLLHPADRERTWEAWHRAEQRGTVFEVEHRLRRAVDGRYLWHLARAVPCLDENQDISGWFGTSTEIEHQKRAANAELERQKFESVGRLAGGVAHDFNNLLAGILGSASLALQSLPPAHPAREMLRNVLEAGERGAELTSRMLAYAGKGDFCAERIRLDALVRETCASMRDAVPPAIEFEFRSEPDLPMVETNERLTRQLVTELIRNALEAIGEQPGTISVTMSGTELGGEAGRYSVLEVRDTGCGMDEETQRNMFDPFFSTKFPGRGLGLASVYGFVKSYGGGIQVDSAPGRGSVVRVLLPAVRGQEAVRRTGTGGSPICNPNS